MPSVPEISDEAHADPAPVNSAYSEKKPAAPLFGATQWLNSGPLTSESVKGKVVLVNFWTYSCINCLRSLPHVGAWAEKYRDQGLVVIGVHAPEFAFEKNIDNVRRALSDLGVTYPVAIDNNFEVWRAFNNRAWPARFLIDAAGRIRHREFGEGEYDRSEHVIEKLLAEAGARWCPGNRLRWTRKALKRLPIWPICARPKPISATTRPGTSFLPAVLLRMPVMSIGLAARSSTSGG